MISPANFCRRSPLSILRWRRHDKYIWFINLYPFAQNKKPIRRSLKKRSERAQRRCEGIIYLAIFSSRNLNSLPWAIPFEEQISLSSHWCDNNQQSVVIQITTASSSLLALFAPFYHNNKRKLDKRRRQMMTEDGKLKNLSFDFILALAVKRVSHFF